MIAPHPFFWAQTCLEKKFVEHIELFDAVEFCYFYSKWFNLNRKAIRISNEMGLPLLGNSDCHLLKYMGISHSIIYAEQQTMESVFAAIEKNHVEVVSNPIFLPKLFLMFFEMFKRWQNVNQKKEILIRPSIEFRKEMEDISI